MQTDPAAATLYASLGYKPVKGVEPTGWYNQMMFEEAARVGKRLCYYAKLLVPPLPQGEEEEGEDGEEAAAT